MLVAHGGVDIISRDVVDGGDAFAGLTRCDEFGDGLSAGAGGEGGLSEAAVGVEHDGDGPAEGVEAAGVAGPVVSEVDLLEEGLGGVGQLQRAVAAQDDDVQRGIEADLLLDFECQASSGGVGLEGGYRTPSSSRRSAMTGRRYCKVTRLARYSRR